MPKKQKEEAECAVRRRRTWIAAYQELGDAGAVCRRFGISRPTLRKWLRRYDADGDAGLTALSRRPCHSPARKVGESEAELIVRLRRERRLGVKRLRIELGRLHGLRLAAPTLHKVLGRYGLSALPQKRRVRHAPKRYSRPVPGECVQLDSCKIRPGLWQFTAIDDCSRYLVAALAPRRSAAATLTFLDQMFEEMPFAVQRVQTDRGAEFFAEAVQRRLMAWSVKFRPIPPRSPHLNGKIERAQRTVLEEFWATVVAQALRPPEAPCPGRGRHRDIQKNFPSTLAGIAEDQGIDPDAVEIWFADEARVGQKNKITRRWARRGTRPSAPHDQRTASTYLFGAVCPQDGKGAALVLPACNSAAMSLHLAEIASMVSPGRHAVLLLDQAGWHLSGQVELPANITLLPLPPKCPELNVMENIWQFMRDNWLSNRVFRDHDDIVDHCCHAWNNLIDQPQRIFSIGIRQWAHRS